LLAGDQKGLTRMYAISSNSSIGTHQFSTHLTTGLDWSRDMDFIAIGH
jgi:hypothetical protein